jgi:hypothetical protein
VSPSKLWVKLWAPLIHMVVLLRQTEQVSSSKEKEARW